MNYREFYKKELACGTKRYFHFLLNKNSKQFMRLLISCLTFLFYSSSSLGQTKVFTKDITNFFVAFDSVYKQSNKVEQLNIVQTLYVDKASDGLKDFMALGGALHQNG